MSSEVYCDFLKDLVDGFRRGEVPLFLTVRYRHYRYLLTYAASRQNLKCRVVSSPRVAVSENLPRQDISYLTAQVGGDTSQSPSTTSVTEKNEKNEKKNDDDDDCLFHITIDGLSRHLREPHPP